MKPKLILGIIFIVILVVLGVYVYNFIIGRQALCNIPGDLLCYVTGVPTSFDTIIQDIKRNIG